LDDDVVAEPVAGGCWEMRMLVKRTDMMRESIRETYPEKQLCLSC
jgi:hypothetical protein